MYKDGFIQNRSGKVSAKLINEDGEAVWFNDGTYDGQKVMFAGNVNILLNKVTPQGDNPARQLVMRGRINGVEFVGFKTDVTGTISLRPHQELPQQGDLTDF